MLVDSHCHLEFADFGVEIEAVMSRAREAGVFTCVSIGTKLATFGNTRAAAERFHDVWCSVGIHPHEAEAEPLDNAAPLLDAARHPKCVGIGETGLDYFYEHSPRAAQAKNFRLHIAAARETGLPLIVHTRDAEDDTIQILTRKWRRGRSPACCIASPVRRSWPTRRWNSGFTSPPRAS